MFDDVRKAMLGDKEAAERLTERGELLPCPKCHSDKVKIEGDGHNVYDPDTLGYLYSVSHSIIYVTCEDCELCSRCVEIEYGKDYEDAEKELIDNWNSRPQLLTKEQIEVLERMETN